MTKIKLIIVAVSVVPALPVLFGLVTFWGTWSSLEEAHAEPRQRDVEMCIRRCVDLGGFNPDQGKVSCEEDAGSH
jgi:hypothetical protein